MCKEYAASIHDPALRRLAAQMSEQYRPGRAQAVDHIIAAERFAARRQVFRLTMNLGVASALLVLVGAHALESGATWAHGLVALALFAGWVALARTLRGPATREALLQPISTAMSDEVVELLDGSVQARRYLAFIERSERRVYCFDGVAIADAAAADTPTSGVHAPTGLQPA